MKGFLQQFSAAAASPAFGVVALVVTLLMMCFLARQGEQLETTEAPKRVVSLELAWTKPCAEKIIGSWNRKEVHGVAVKQVLLDYIFIAGYACLLLYTGLAAEKAAQAAGLSSLAHAAHFGAWGGLIAGGLDCLENVGLLAMLWGHPTAAVALMTSAFAFLKFVLAGVAIVVSAAAFTSWAVQRLRPPQRSN
jgi:hypothetical protein